MGYYTGNGIVTSGGQKKITLRTFAILGGGSFKVTQSCVFKTTRKAGVSLSTAQAASVSESMTSVSGGSGQYAWIVFDANGSRSTPNYVRIGDSNLFDLTITDESFSASTQSA